MSTVTALAEIPRGGILRVWHGILAFHFSVIPFPDLQTLRALYSDVTCFLLGILIGWSTCSRASSAGLWGRALDLTSAGRRKPKSWRLGHVHILQMTWLICSLTGSQFLRSAPCMQGGWKQFGPWLGCDDLLFVHRSQFPITFMACQSK